MAEKTVTELSKLNINQLKKSLDVIDKKMNDQEVKRDVALTNKLQRMKNRITNVEFKTLKYYDKNKKKFPEIAKASRTTISLLQMYNITGQQYKEGYEKESKFKEAFVDNKGLAIGVGSTVAILGGAGFIASAFGESLPSLLKSAIVAMWDFNPAATIAVLGGASIVGFTAIMNKIDKSQKLKQKTRQLKMDILTSVENNNENDPNVRDLHETLHSNENEASTAPVTPVKPVTPVVAVATFASKLEELKNVNPKNIIPNDLSEIGKDIKKNPNEYSSQQKDDFVNIVTKYTNYQKELKIEKLTKDDKFIKTIVDFEEQKNETRKDMEQYLEEREATGHYDKADKKSLSDFGIQDVDKKNDKEIRKEFESKVPNLSKFSKDKEIVNEAYNKVKEEYFVKGIENLAKIDNDAERNMKIAQYCVKTGKDISQITKQVEEIINKTTQPGVE